MENPPMISQGIWWSIQVDQRVTIINQIVGYYPLLTLKKPASFIRMGNQPWSNSSCIRSHSNPWHRERCQVPSPDWTLPFDFAVTWLRALARNEFTMTTTIIKIFVSHSFQWTLAIVITNKPLNIVEGIVNHASFTINQYRYQEQLRTAVIVSGDLQRWRIFFFCVKDVVLWMTATNEAKQDGVDWNGYSWLING